jgi:hypothetical protein
LLDIYIKRDLLAIENWWICGAMKFKLRFFAALKGSVLLEHLKNAEYRNRVVHYVVEESGSLEFPLVANVSDWSLSGLWLDSVGLKFFCGVAAGDVSQQTVNLR